MGLNTDIPFLITEWFFFIFKAGFLCVVVTFLEVGSWTVRRSKGMYHHAHLLLVIESQLMVQPGL